MLNFLSNKKGIGFFIDANRIYAVQLSSAMGRVGLLGYAECEYDPHAAGGADETALPLNTAIKRVLTKLGTESRAVAGGLAGKDAIIRYFEMPLIPKEEWPSAIRYEAQKYMTLDTEDLYFNYEVFKDLKLKKMRVVFLASSKDAVHKLMNVYLDGGLNLRALEPTSLSLVRAFLNEHPIKEGEVHALVDLRNDGVINILLVKGQVLLMARDSVILKSQEGNEDVRLPDFRALLTEVNLSFNYFLKNFKSEEIKSVFFMRDTSDLFREWDKRLETELGMTVTTESLNAILGVAKGYSPGRSIALGLALRDISQAQYKNSNLIPTEILRSQKKAVESQEAAEVAKTVTVTIGDDRQLLKKGVALVAGAAAGIVAMVHIVMILLMLSQKSALEKMLKGTQKPESVTSAAAPIEELNATEKRLKQQLSYISALADKRAYWTLKMGELARAIPPTAVVTRLSYSDTVTVEGNIVSQLSLDGKIVSQPKVNSLDEMNRFAASLKNNKDFMQNFSELRIASIRRVEDQLNFVIECKSEKRS